MEIAKHNSRIYWNHETYLKYKTDTDKHFESNRETNVPMEERPESK